MTDKQKETLKLTRRSLFRGIAAGAAFTIPLMASFSKKGIEVSTAEAAGKKAPKKAPKK